MLACSRALHGPGTTVSAARPVPLHIPPPSSPKPTRVDLPPRSEFTRLDAAMLNVPAPLSNPLELTVEASKHYATDRLTIAIPTILAAVAAVDRVFGDLVKFLSERNL